ncbi:MAG: hypothetical protein DCC51_17215, partial [Anaerolineae bacterium]
MNAGRSADEMVLISVSDRGAGIPKEFREVIFDKFRRIKDDTSAK